ACNVGRFDVPIRKSDWNGIRAARSRRVKRYAFANLGSGISSVRAPVALSGIYVGSLALMACVPQCRSGHTDYMRRAGRRESSGGPPDAVRERCALHSLELVTPRALILRLPELG